MMASRVPADRAMSRDELRHVVARIEGRAPAFDPEVAAADDRGWRLGIDVLDRAFGGALPVAALHTLHAAEVGDVPAAQGFALALAARSGRPGGLLWVATTRHVREWGLP